MKPFRSIRSRLLALSIVTVTVSAFVCTLIGAFQTARLGHEASEQSLHLLCDSGKHNLNSYFKSVEQSLNTLSELFSSELKDIPDEDFNTSLSDYVEESRAVFRAAATNTSGVLTYYYRIDPSVEKDTNESGFWFTNLKGEGFKEHEVTDLSDDHYECRWFYEPKNTGAAVWLPPYLTDNLETDIYMVSYNVPVTRKGQFIGVVGIEIGYKTLGDQIKDIKALESGYAFILDDETGSIIYHPTIDILSMPEDKRPSIPENFLAGFKAGQHHVAYTFQGVEKHSYWLDLSNGMAIVVAVPVSEINHSWTAVIVQNIVISAVLIIAFAAAAFFYARHITKPLQKLTDAAREIDAGNYNVELNFKRDDEIGVLANTFDGLIKNLGETINDLNGLAYADALTSVKNKSAFDLRLSQLQEKIEAGERPEFAIGMFDCDGLKEINDRYGHDKGDVYLRNACNLLCRVYGENSVYRIGGDEFAIILEGEQYQQRDDLLKHFVSRELEICSFSKEPWEKIRVSVGVAAYDPNIDKGPNEVLVHADHLMYINKRARKK